MALSHGASFFHSNSPREGDVSAKAPTWATSASTPPSAISAIAFQKKMPASRLPLSISQQPKQASRLIRIIKKFPWWREQRLPNNWRTSGCMDGARTVASMLLVFSLALM